MAKRSKRSGKPQAIIKTPEISKIPGYGPVDAKPVPNNDGNVVSLRVKADQRLNSLETVRWSWWTQWRELSRFINPRLGRFLETPNEGWRGRNKTRAIIDSTATTSSERFASGLMSGITSPARPWFKLRAGAKTFDEGTPAKKWLDEVEKRMMEILAGSNFYRSMASIYEEIGVFGTGVMIMYEDYEDVLRCFPVVAGEYYLGVDERLEVVTLGRKIVMTTAEMVGRFGLDAVSDSVRTQYKQGNLDQEWMVAHLIMPNDERVWDAPDAMGKPWLELYWQWGEGSNVLMEVKGFSEKPFIAPRWNVTANDAYGRSPGMTALGDVKQLQVMTKRKAQLVDKLVNPPLIGDAALRNEPTSVIPGALNYVPTGAAERGLKPIYEMDSQGLPAITRDIQEVQARIKTNFFEDLFLAISQIQGVQTATFVVEKKEEKMLMLGPALERIHDEGLRPIIDRLFGLMTRAGLLPPNIPPELAGKHLSVEFVSTLAQAQKAVATTAVERLYQFAGSLAGSVPDVLDNLDTDETIREYADMLGAPAKLVNSEQQVASIRAARAKAQQQQQVMEQSLAAVEGAKNLSQTDVGGGQNALALMAGRAA